MNKEQLKKLRKNLKEEAMSIEKFLLKYFNIKLEINNKNHKNKIAHKDIKSICSAKQVFIDEINYTIKDIYTGNVIPVKDYKGNICFYEAPQLDFEEKIEQSTILIPEQTHTMKIGDIDLNGLNTYQLSVLKKELQKEKRMTEANKVGKIIKEKKQQKQKTKKYVNAKNNKDWKREWRNND